MAFDHLLTHAVVVFALVTAGGSLLLTVDDQAQDLMDELKVSWHGALERADSRVTLQSRAYDAGALTETLIVKNTGKFRLDPSKVTLLVDGVPVAFTYSVEGAASSTVWQKDENATFVVAGVTSAPGFVSLALEKGRATPFLIQPVLTTITVTPDPVSVTAGATQQFSASAYDQFGSPMTVTFSWSATAGSVDATGLLTAQTTAATGLGVTATSGSVSGSAVVDVVADALTTITVTPAGGWTIATDGTQQFTASGSDQYGNPVTPSTVWGTDVGSIDTAGLLTAPSTPACGTVTATDGAIQGTSAGCAEYSVHVANTQKFRGGTETNTFQDTQSVTVKITVRDSTGALTPSVTVSVSVYDNADQSGSPVHTMSAVTDGSGLATFTSFKPKDVSATLGTWSVLTTGLTGTSTTYDSASDVDNPDTFTVT